MDTLYHGMRRAPSMEWYGLCLPPPSYDSHTLHSHHHSNPFFSVAIGGLPYEIDICFIPLLVF